MRLDASGYTPRAEVARAIRWVISETVGHRKPDPAIFAAAAETAGCSLNGAWMIGDSPQADIGGASAAGISSVWISAGRPWPALPLPAHPHRDQCRRGRRSPTEYRRRVVLAPVIASSPSETRAERPGYLRLNAGSLISGRPVFPERTSRPAGFPDKS
jgi:hypothetical protein